MASQRQRKARHARRRNHRRTPIPLAEHVFDIVAGRRPLPTVEAKYHHYVPQMHLRGFSPNADTDKGARVFRFDKDRQAVDYERVDRSGGGRRFNRISHEEEEKRDGVEVWLGLIESYAAPDLVKLVGQRTKPTKPGRFNLGMYIAFLGARTPHALAMSQTINKMSLDLHWGTMTHDPRWFRSLFREADSSATDEELERARKHLREPDSIDYPEPRTAAFESSFRAAGEVASLVVPMNWTLLVSDDPLILGDHPVTHHDSEPPRFPWTEPMWATSPTTVTTVPLTTHTALELSIGNRGYGVRQLSAHEARSLNLRTWGWASRYVFAEREADLKHIREEAERSPEEVPRASRLHQVVLAPADSFPPSEPNDQPEGWPEFLVARDENGQPTKCRYWPVPTDQPDEMRRAATWASKAVQRLSQTRKTEPRGQAVDPRQARVPSTDARSS